LVSLGFHQVFLVEFVGFEAYEFDVNLQVDLRLMNFLAYFMMVISSIT
jgi:hypothetical protein